MPKADDDFPDAQGLAAMSNADYRDFLRDRIHVDHHEFLRIKGGSVLATTRRQSLELVEHLIHLMNEKMVDRGDK